MYPVSCHMHSTVIINNIIIILSIVNPAHPFCVLAISPIAQVSFYTVHVSLPINLRVCPCHEIDEPECCPSTTVGLRYKSKPKASQQYLVIANHRLCFVNVLETLGICSHSCTQGLRSLFVAHV